MDISEEVFEWFKRFMRIVEVSVFVEMDDGFVKVFIGFCVQYNWVCGLIKGGIRWYLVEIFSIVKVFVIWMIWKVVVVDFFYGGGKGGIIVDLKKFFEREQERFVRSYIRVVYDVIGLWIDILVFDVYINLKIMVWMMDEYEIIMRRKGLVFGVIIGKLLGVGGIVVRMDVIVCGVVFIIREVVKVFGWDDFKGKIIVIQGYGNVGYYFYKIMSEEFGMKVVVVSDSKGGIYNLDGFLLVDEVFKWKKEYGLVKDMFGIQNIINEEFFEFEVDIFVLSVIEGVIIKENVDNVKVKIVVEVVNGLVILEVDEIFYEKGIFQILDFFCNVGGVIVSYFEWVQNINGFYWMVEEIRKRFDDKMIKVFWDVFNIYKEKNIYMRDVVYVVVVSRVYEVMKYCGWVKK